MLSWMVYLKRVMMSLLGFLGRLRLWSKSWTNFCEFVVLTPTIQRQVKGYYYFKYNQIGLQCLKKNYLSSLATLQNFLSPLNSPLPIIYSFFQPYKDSGMRTSFTHPILPECLNVYVCVHTHTHTMFECLYISYL